MQDFLLAFSTIFAVVMIGAFLHRSVAGSRQRSLQALPQPERARDVSPTAVTTAVAVIDSFNFSLPLCREVFTGVLIAGRDYDITITGVLSACFQTTEYGHVVNVDALYFEDANGSFAQPHNSLYIDTKKVPHADLAIADRELHSYTFRFAGKGEKMAVCFGLPPGYTKRYNYGGSLYVSIQKTAATIEARAKAEEEARERAKAAKAEAERQARIQELEALKEYEPHLADPAHLEKYAASYKDELLDDRDEIREKYQDFHTNLLPWLKEQKRDDLIPFGEWEAKAFAIAARLDVEPPPAPPPKPKLTAKEIRAFKVRRQQTKIDDKIALQTGQINAKIALRKARIDAILKARAFLDQYDLDPEERDVHEQELIDDILQEDDNGGHTKII